MKTSSWLGFWMFCQPAWGVRSYSIGPPAARTVGTKSTGGFYQADVSPCISLGTNVKTNPISGSYCIFTAPLHKSIPGERRAWSSSCRSSWRTGRRPPRRWREAARSPATFCGEIWTTDCALIPWFRCSAMFLAAAAFDLTWLEER